MKAKRPIVCKNAKEYYWLKKNEVLLRERIPDVLIGKVDEERWPGYFIVEIAPQRKKDSWSAEFMGARVRNQPTRRHALEAAKTMVKEHIQDFYDQMTDWINDV